MDLQTLSEKGGIGLLTVPTSDLIVENTGSKSAIKVISCQKHHANKDINNDDRHPMLLMKLPSGWSVKDLVGSQFVASESKQASFVIEPKGKSYSVLKLETSNVLVLVPPVESVDVEDDADDAVGGASSSRAPKRMKVSNNKEQQDNTTISVKTSSALVPTPCRLLSKGGNGASFLELREKTLYTKDLIQLLKPHAFDPFNATNHNKQSTSFPKGRTIVSLAYELQVSKAEIREGLYRIGAFPVVCESDVPLHDMTTEYVLLSEECKLECYSAVLSALAEVDEYSDYARTTGNGIKVDDVVLDALARMSDEERFDNAEHVLRFCIYSLAIDNHSNEKFKDLYTKSHVRLDVTKVAVCVARRIFHRQSQPWEDVLFMSRWQAELPGIGDTYQVDAKMLRGVAVNIQVEDEVFWKYLPVESLSLEPSEGFDTLFALQEKWELDDLSPYLFRWADKFAHSNLLLRHSKLITVTQDGVPMKFYTKL